MKKEFDSSVVYLVPMYKLDSLDDNTYRIKCRITKNNDDYIATPLDSDHKLFAKRMFPAERFSFLLESGYIQTLYSERI